MKTFIVFLITLLNSLLGIIFHLHFSPQLRNGGEKLIGYETYGSGLIQNAGFLLIVFPLVVCLWGLLSLRFSKLKDCAWPTVFSLIFAAFYLIYAWLALTPILAAAR